jgi:hypothetical protein
VRCAAAVLACTAPERSAAGDESRSCDDAFTSAPKLVKAGKLLLAHEALLRCSSESCPTAMRSLCAEDLRQVELRMPTIVFVAKGSDGAELRAIRVVEDGRTLEDHLDGRSVDVDPGDHVFHFERAEGDSVAISVLVHEGEKARQVVATFPRAVTPSTASTVLRPTTGWTSGSTSGPESPATPARPVPWTAFLAGGVAVAATGSFAYFGLHGLSQRSALDACKGSCDHDSVQTVRTNLALADGSWIVALVATAAAVGIYLLR